MRRLYLVRHAEAADLDGGHATCDADRKLTPKGRRQARRMAALLDAVGLANPVVAASPLLRAVQTAEILAQRLVTEDLVIPMPAMAPGGDAEDVLAFLRSLHGRDLVAVGHMPDLALMAAWLLGAAGRGGIEFKKAGTAAFRFDGTIAPGMAVLEWLVHPRLTRARRLMGTAS